MKKAVGLGKRKVAPEEEAPEKEICKREALEKDIHGGEASEKEIHEGKASEKEVSEVYFPMDENTNEVDQVEFMLAAAEEHLDDPEKCVPLFNGVIHECDRIERIVQAIEDDDKETLSCIDPEVIESFKDVKLDGRLYRIMGDAVYRLSQIHNEGKVCSLPYIQKALEMYQEGIKIDSTYLPLQFSYLRAQIVCKLEEEDEAWMELANEYLLLIETAEKRSEVILQALELFNLIEPIDCVPLVCKLLELIRGEQQTTPMIIGQLQALYNLANSAFDYEESDNEEEDIEQFLKYMTQAQTLVDSIDFEHIAKEDPDGHKALLPHISQYYLSMGCFDEYNAADIDTGDPTVSKDASKIATKIKPNPPWYEKAIEVWKTLKDLYGVPVPEDIIELEKSVTI